MTTSIKTLAEGMGDFTARLDSYNVYLPKQARWQAELLLTDFTHDPQNQRCSVQPRGAFRLAQRRRQTT